MSQKKGYHYQLNIKTYKRLNKVLTRLPDFCKYFFIGIENNTQPGTQLNYAHDLSIFFRYIKSIKSEYKDTIIKDLPIKILNEITSFEIEQFVSYCKDFTDEYNHHHTNSKAGLKRKLACIRSFYKYAYKHGMTVANIAELVDVPKIEDKNIIRLNNNQVDQVLENIETGEYLTPNQQSYHHLYKLRDYAIISLLLGTGLRVSECVGIDLSDIDFEECSVQIIRKGGNQDLVYFSDEVKAALLAYYKERITKSAAPDDDQAFFLSKNKTRLSVRSLEIMVHKYTNKIKDVSPHKLRATFGTSLYVATKDIYLVADALGHSNVDTTRKHYAEIPEREKRNARNTLKLRKHPH